MQQRSVGLYQALNEAVEASRGQWILFVHSDDELAFLDVNAIEKLDNGIHHGAIEFIRDGKRIFGRRPPVFRRSWLKHITIVFHPNALYPRVALLAHPFEPKKYGREADMHQLYELGKTLPFKRFKGLCYRFHIHPLSTTVAALNSGERKIGIMRKLLRVYLFLFFEDERWNRLRSRLRGKRVFT